MVWLFWEAFKKTGRGGQIQKDTETDEEDELQSQIVILRFVL